MKIKRKKQNDNLTAKLTHKFCPFCKHPVKIGIHTTFDKRERYYISHTLPVGDEDGVDCILSCSITFENIDDLVDRWEEAYEN